MWEVVADDRENDEYLTLLPSFPEKTAAAGFPAQKCV